MNSRLAGLSFQVASLCLFMVMASYFAFMVYKNFSARSIRFANLTGSQRFRLFEIALAVATVLIFVRCCFRVAELKQGFDGSIANSQPLFMVFEGPMIFIAVTGLTILHPGIAFMGRWGEANFGVWAGKKATEPASTTQWTELNEPSQVSLNKR